MLASSQQFCVKWNSYSSNLQNVFPRLLTSEHFVDITLACEGQMIKCHKVVLSACSTYFEKLLVQNPCQHPIIFMKDMKHWEVQALVDFMYKGEVNVSQEELNSLLVAAEALQIRGLCGSDQGNTGKRENLGRPQAGENRLPTVSLPHDTVLSGRESPPFKRRRNIAEDQECKLSNIISPTQNNRASLVPTSSALEVNSVPLAAPSGHSLSSETDLHTDHVDNKKGIKQEVDLEDCYLEDADGPDEEYSLEQQEDSDSNNREDAVPASPMDQPGPSGMTSAPGNAALDKATTGSRWQASPDLTMTVVDRGQVKRKRGRPRKTDIVVVPASRPLPAPASQSSSTMTIIEEYIPTSLTSQQASILNAASANLENRRTSPQYNLMGTPPLDIFGACPNVRVKRRFITPEQKQRQLELARARKKRFRERLKAKALLQQRSAEELAGKKMDSNN